MSFQTPITIAEAIGHIENNRYLLPAIQREFEWESKKIEWLFDSIMQNYPISSFLFWRVEGETKQSYKFYKFLRIFREEFQTHNEEFDTSTHNDFTAVLDGQQRLTSLYIGLKGSYAYKKPRVMWKDTEYAIPTRYLYLNILESLKDEEDGRKYEFKFLTQEEYEQEPTKWFKVSKILSLRNNFEFNKFLDEHTYKDNEFAYETLSKFHEAIFHENIINFYLEKEQDIDKALNIFIRINSGGEPLNFSDLLMSIAVANWTEKDARKEIHKLSDEIRDKGFLIEKDFILKSFLLLHSRDVRFKVNNFKRANAMTFEKEWDSIKLTIHTVFDLVKKFGFTENSLTSKNALLPVVYYLYHRKISDGFVTKKEFEEDRRAIKKWLHSVLIKRIFGGQADQVLTTIRAVFTKDVTKEKIFDSCELFPSKLIQEKLKGTTKDMSVDDEFIENLLKSQKDSGITFSILALLYPHLDYANGDFHKDHLHPESSFKHKKLKEEMSEEETQFYLNTENYNSILNLQLLDANENESKQNKPLNTWVEFESEKQSISIEKFCENHLIPNILEFDKFQEFIEKRKELLKEKLKELVN